MTEPHLKIKGKSAQYLKAEYDEICENCGDIAGNHYGNECSAITYSNYQKKELLEVISKELKNKCIETVKFINCQPADTTYERGILMGLKEVKQLIDKKLTELNN